MNQQLKILLVLVFTVLVAVGIPFGVAAAFGQLDWDKVLERVLLFKFQILVLFAVSLLRDPYLLFWKRHWEENLKDSSWLQKSRPKIFGLIYFPLFCVFGPAREELVFRVAIVLVFTLATPGVWWAIVLSAIFFGLGHLIGNQIFAISGQEVTERMKETGESYEESRKQLQNSPEVKKRLTILNIFRPMITSGFGFLIGWIAVSWGENSLWWCWLIHAAWNLVFPMIAQIIIMLTCFFWAFLKGVVSLVFDFLKDKKESLERQARRRQNGPVHRNGA